MDAQQPKQKPKHLYLVIHGMGPQIEKRGRFERNSKEPFNSWENTAKTHIHNHNIVGVLKSTFAQCLPALKYHEEEIAIRPIEWHSKLHKLDSVDQRLEKITLPTIPVIRALNNDYLSDVLYAFTVLHGQIVIDIIADLLNQEYDKFKKENAEFDGTISILAHSLGGLLTYDIISHQPPAAQSEIGITYPMLKFKPICLFTVGCPIGAVLVFRKQEPLQGNRGSRTKSGCRYYNIFHAYDPLGYRYEPLLEGPVRPPVLVPDIPSSSKSFLSGITLYPPALVSAKNKMTEYVSLDRLWSWNSNVDAALEASIDDAEELITKATLEQSTEEHKEKPYRKRCRSSGRLKQKMQPGVGSPSPDRILASPKRARSSTPRKSLLKDAAEAQMTERDQRSVDRLAASSVNSNNLSADEDGIGLGAAAALYGAMQMLTGGLAGIAKRVSSRMWSDPSMNDMSDSCPERTETETEASHETDDRIDYQLPLPSWAGSISREYLLGMRSHFAYFSKPEVLTFVLKQTDLELEASKKRESSTDIDS